MKWLKDYFDLNRKEENGMIALVGLVVLLFAMQFVWVYLSPTHNVGLAMAKNPIDVFNGGHQADSNESAEYPSNSDTIKIHPFDPNTIDLKGLENLGISPTVANHIIHYREKGGHFYKREDLKKIYGLDLEKYEELKPFISITSKSEKHDYVLVDLNIADSLDLLSVKGIGPVFASRILYMRNKLGAFINKNQLLDVFGIDAERYQSIQNQVFISKKPVHTININKADSKALMQNPYIHYKLANIIVNYREAHGTFKTIEDLKKIYALDEKTFEKAKPYLRVE